MKILEREIELDLLDIETMKKYENALEKYMESLQEAKKFKGKDSEGAEMLCQIVYDFFDELIGKDNSIQLLGEKKNYRNCIKAMQEIIEEKQKSEKEINDILGRYSLNEESINS